jgi:hypothetical protein
MASNRVYRHRERPEVLKVALDLDPASQLYARAQFRRCLAVSKVYAHQGVMPEVLVVGDDFSGSGLPWLRERFIEGQNLGAAYLDDPAFWTANAPALIVRLARILAGGPKRELRSVWEDKLAGMVCPLGYEELYTVVVESGRFLAENCRTGHIIHGDLQFGNLLVQREGGAARMWLIDWEVSEVATLGYEFAMLYTFLLGPEDQVEARFRARYSVLKPLRAFWDALAPLLWDELSISKAEFRQSVVFRMGNGWLYQLDQALRRGDSTRANELARDIKSLVSGRSFDILQV